MATPPTPMMTPRIAEAGGLLRDFHFVDPAWGGTASLPCWGHRELSVNIYPDDGDFSPRQLDTLRALLSYPHDLRPAFERALFAYYKADVEGSYCAYVPGTDVAVRNSGLPKLSEPSQVWALIDEPEAYIHWTFRTPSAVEFELSFNCEWDTEHGLGVLYRDWEPVKFGGWNS